MIQTSSVHNRDARHSVPYRCWSSATEAGLRCNSMDQQDLAYSSSQRGGTPIINSLIQRPSGCLLVLGCLLLKKPWRHTLVHLCDGVNKMSPIRESMFVQLLLSASSEQKDPRAALQLHHANYLTELFLTYLLTTAPVDYPTTHRNSIHLAITRKAHKLWD